MEGEGIDRAVKTLIREGGWMEEGLVAGWNSSRVDEEWAESWNF